MLVDSNAKEYMRAVSPIESTAHCFYCAQLFKFTVSSIHHNYATHKMHIVPTKAILLSYTRQYLVVYWQCWQTDV